MHVVLYIIILFTFVEIRFLIFILNAAKHVLWCQWFNLQVSVVSYNPYKCKESYSHWDVCYNSLVSFGQIHMVGSSSKDAEVQKKWKLKRIQAPALVHPPSEPKHHKTDYDNSQNGKKIGTVFIPTDIEGRDKKQNATKQKKQSSPVATLWLVGCMVRVKNYFQSEFQLWMFVPAR